MIPTHSDQERSGISNSLFFTPDIPVAQATGVSGLMSNTWQFCVLIMFVFCIRERAIAGLKAAITGDAELGREEAEELDAQPGLLVRFLRYIAAECRPTPNYAANTPLF